MGAYYTPPHLGEEEWIRTMISIFRPVFPGRCAPQGKLCGVVEFPPRGRPIGSPTYCALPPSWSSSHPTSPDYYGQAMSFRSQGTKVRLVLVARYVHVALLPNSNSVAQKWPYVEYISCSVMQTSCHVHVSCVPCHVTVTCVWSGAEVFVVGPIHYMQVCVCCRRQRKLIEERGHG